MCTVECDANLLLLTTRSGDSPWPQGKGACSTSAEQSSPETPKKRAWYSQNYHFISSR